MSQLLQCLEETRRQLVDVESAYLDAQQRAKELASTIARKSLLLSCDRLVRKFRSPQTSFNLWPIGVILVSTTLCATLAFLLAFTFDANSPTTTTIVIAFGAIGGSLASLILFFPSDAALTSRISGEESQLAVDRETLSILQKRSQELYQATVSLKRNRDEIIASVRFRGEQLLLENWKAMRDVDWENFLARAFNLLGFQVETTRSTGDQGVDLVVSTNGRKIAVQAKGYFHAVSNGAVQEAVAGMKHYGCSSCAVVTNSRYTKSARELAQSNDCLLIGEDEFPEFVRGNIPL